MQRVILKAMRKNRIYHFHEGWKEESIPHYHHWSSLGKLRDQARGRLGRNSRPRGRNFALNGTQGEVGVSLKKKKKKKKIFFFFFFLARLIFILSPHKCKLW